MLTDERITAARQKARDAVHRAVLDYAHHHGELMLTHNQEHIHARRMAKSTLHAALDLYRDLERAEAVAELIERIDLSALSQSMDEDAHGLASVTRPVAVWRDVYERTAELERLVLQVEGA